MPTGATGEDSAGGKAHPATINIEKTTNAEKRSCMERMRQGGRKTYPLLVRHNLDDIAILTSEPTVEWRRKN